MSEHRNGIPDDAQRPGGLPQVAAATSAAPLHPCGRGRR